MSRLQAVVCLVLIALVAAAPVNKKHNKKAHATKAAKVDLEQVR